MVRLIIEKELPITSITLIIISYSTLADLIENVPHNNYYEIVLTEIKYVSLDWNNNYN